MSNYTSDMLCHFVGRSKSTEEEKFELLLKIIGEGQLKANLVKPTNPELRTSSRYKGENFGEIFEHCDCVCFCDIPEDMLEIHTSKYSRIGMGFSKSFLIQQGVRPVTYVPIQAHISEPTKTETPMDSPMEYYLYLNNLSNNFLPILAAINSFCSFEQLLLEIMKSPIKQHMIPFDGNVLTSMIKGKSHQMLFSLITAWATQCAYIKYLMQIYLKTILIIIIWNESGGA